MLLKYLHMLSVSSVSGRTWTASWIALRGTMDVVPTQKWDFGCQLPMCNGCIVGWCPASIITIPAVWPICPVWNDWTGARSPWTVDSASWRTNWRCKHAGMHPAVEVKWLSQLVPIQSSTASFHGGICFVHVVVRVQQTIWTACSLHLKHVTRITTVLYEMYFPSLSGLNSWLWWTSSVKSANLLKHQAIWFCRSPFGIAHH